MAEDAQTYQLARFALNTSYDDLPAHTVQQLKKHLLDSIGSFIHAIPRPAIRKLILHLQSLQEGGKCRVPVLGSVAVDRAAQLYTALVRYPDFMDNYIGKEATCHPSDNIGPTLAAAQLIEASGKDFLTAMAIAYEIECRLVEEIPVMIHGFDHTTLLTYSVTAALSKLFGLTEDQTAHALGIAGCSFNPLVTSRASYTYEWKGFASSFVAAGCLNIVLLAKQGMTGPLHLFKGPKGFNEVMEMELKYDWTKEDFGLIKKCVLKNYNAEVHTQSAIEAALELRKENSFSTKDISQVDITTFLTCYHIVGGGAYGDRTKVFSKEQADHSMMYVIAAALLDGEVYPEQFLPERINRPDVQELLKKVKVHTKFPLHKPVKLAGVLDPYTAAYPDKLISKVKITLNDGVEFEREKEDYHGFHTRPLTWEGIVEKFRKLSADVINVRLQQQLIETIGDLENRKINDLTGLLETISGNDNKKAGH
jgi:2-methylcitrate dehydratase